MNFFERIYLKCTDPKTYAAHKENKRHEALLNRIRQANAEPFEMPPASASSFKHSGNCGDIIYAMPAMQALSGGTDGAGINLYLQTDREVSYGKSVRHPLGNVSLNERMVQMIAPLLLSQKRFASCETYHGQAFDYDLDKIRDYPFLFDRGCISRWYFLVYPGACDLGAPWLTAEPSPVTRDAIVVARSSRYRAPFIDYRFLQKYPDIYFVGLEEEYRDMREQIPSLSFLEVEDFLQLAELISGSRLFIGNQSFPFAIAEALKVNRLLELYYNAPNVVISGSNGYEFCFQKQFEYLVRNRYERGPDR